MKYNIHPHLGFVNTQFTIWSDNQENDFSIKDSQNGETIYVPKGTVKVNKTFTVGEHKLQLYDDKNELIQEETIIVRPSIKVGGSTITDYFILPNWIVLVMKDRTYFYNRRTEQEFFEYNVYPEKVEEIRPDILCLIDYKYKLSFYKLPEFSLIFTKHKSTVKFYNDYCIVYLEDNKLIIYSYSNGTFEYSYTSYYIDDDSEILYVYNEKEIIIIDLRGLTTNIIKVDIEYAFISFLGGNFILFQDNIKEIYIYDFIEKKIYHIDLLKELLLQECGLRKLTSKKTIVNDIGVYNDFKKKVNIKLLSKDSAVLEILVLNEYKQRIGSVVYTGCKRDVHIFDCRDNILHIENLGDVKLEYSDKDVVIYTSSDDSYNNKNAYVYKINQQTCIVLENISIEHYNKELYFIKKEDNETIIYNRFGIVILRGMINKRMLYKYGLVSMSDDKIEKKQFYYLDKERAIETDLPNYPSNSYIMLNNTTYYYKENKLYPLPFAVKIIREKDNCILYEENDKLRILVWSDLLKKYEDKNIFSNLDRRYFENVIFTSDTRKLLCEDKKGKLYYYDIENDDFSDFDIEIPVKRVHNTYQPLLSVQNYRNPKLIDPISLKPISSMYLQDYVFSDSCGRYICETNFIKDVKEKTKYILVKDTFSEDEFKIEVKNIHFLNYISFSCDLKYISIVGATTGSGYIHVYDLEKKETIFEAPGSGLKIEMPCPNAIWASSFDKNNNIAFYNSVPNTYLINLNKYISNDNNDLLRVINGRSFLCFSSSGKCIALSVQGYTAYATNAVSFGHNHSTKIYIRKMDNLQLEIGPFDDLGCSGIKKLNKTTACAAAFSNDDSKLLVVGADGTFIVRDVNWNINV